MLLSTLTRRGVGPFVKVRPRSAPFGDLMPILRWAIEGLGSVHGSGMGQPLPSAPAEPARGWEFSGGISVTSMVPQAQRVVRWRLPSGGDCALSGVCAYD